MSQRALGFALIAILTGGCGYRLARGEPDPIGPFKVESSLGGAAYPEAHRGATRGAADELARTAQLASGSGSHALIRIDIARVEIQSGAITADTIAGDEVARAGSLRIAVTGRGRLGVARDGQTEWIRDTGDVIETDVVARPPDAASWPRARSLSIESTSRRLGERLVERLLLLP